MSTHSRRGVLLVAGLLAPGLLTAAVSVPHLFSNGEFADADQVNANFAALATAVDATNTRLDNLGALAGKSSVTNADVAADAAISGSKVVPAFGSQALSAGTITSGCPSGWSSYENRFCYSPVQAPTHAHNAEQSCLRNYGARTCSVGEYYLVGTSACSGNYCWTSGFCGGTAGLRVRSGTGWDCVKWDTSYQYRCCKPKTMG